MANEADPRLVAVADPGRMQARLDADLHEVAALGRSGASVDLTLGDASIPEQVRQAAGLLGFESPVDAATQSLKHIDDLPADERGSGSPIGPYHRAAGRTVAEGELKAHTTNAGVRRLVFQRVAPVAAGISVTLEAAVRIEGAGRPYLEAFGWTTRGAVYTFGGTRGGYLTEALDGLRGDGPFDQVMLMVLATGLGLPGDDDQAGRMPLAELMAGRGGSLGAYVSKAESYALAAGAGGAFGACLYRSALETLFENYLGGVAFSLVDMDDVNDVDEELRDRLPCYDPLPSEAVPPGIPPHHWWWESAVRL
ncbi:hypothetical protein [Spirillospora sp. CA-294931]|uniref:hypothetical protein n=1 Tax=Spirillospora sp. CA-294931 TaxID=3240042 RepID=UPI003D92BB28